ncbi:MAG: ATP-binding cassette domain-containing protein [Clostridia bacterium]|nr:ATP-binding cassette domain-containing protein [Clostridia bacterium]
MSVFTQDTLVKDNCIKSYKKLTDLVETSINRLAIVKDTQAYTFKVSLNSAIETYFKGLYKNPKELERYKRQSDKHASLTSKGREPTWKVTPPQLVDLELTKSNIVDLLTSLRTSYENELNGESQLNVSEVAHELIEFLKDKATSIVYTVTSRMAKNIAIKLMEEVGIPEPRRRYRQYPFEFSGGMRQRIVIAIALAANPDILICDEPTTALDVTIQAQILELINNLKAERNLSVIFITHDLGVVANMADRIAVMYAGKIVEYGTAEEVFYDPRHPYTWALLASMPDLDTNEKLDAIPGTPPNMIYPPVGDAFAVRNKYALQIDFEQQPPMFKISDTHYASTWLLHPNAPKANPPKIVTDRIQRMKKLNEEADK